MILNLTSPIIQSIYLPIKKRIETVLLRNHTVSEATLKLEKYYGPIEDEFFTEEEEQESQTYSDQSKSSSLLQGRNSSKSLTSGHFTIRSFNTPSLVIDKTKLILSNIQENINIQQLDFYVQLICHNNRADINEINWSLEKKGKLLIDFKREIDINKLLTEFNNSQLNNLNGKPIQVETVNKTKTLVVLVTGV